MGIGSPCAVWDYSSKADAWVSMFKAMAAINATLVTLSSLKFPHRFGR